MKGAGITYLIFSGLGAPWYVSCIGLVTTPAYAIGALFGSGV